MRLWGDTIAIAEDFVYNHPIPHYNLPMVNSLMAFLVDSAEGEYESLKSPDPEDVVAEREGRLGAGQWVRLARWTAKEVVRGVLAKAGGGGGVWVRNGGNGFGLVRMEERGVKRERGKEGKKRGGVAGRKETEE